MIPLPLIITEIMMALGAALVAGRLLALVRPRPGAQVVARGRVITEIMIGLLVFVWGLATFVVRLGE